MEIFHDRGASGSRLSGIVLVIVVHVVLFCALVYGGNRVALAFVKPPLLVELLEERRPPPPEAVSKLPPPKFVQPPKAFIPPPEIQVQLSPIRPEATISSVTQTPPPSAPVQPAARIGDNERIGSTIVGPVFEYTGCELLEYPSDAMASRQQGVVTLLLLIDEKGNAIESKVAKSSGYPELDEAARSGMGNCKYRPGKVDGKPAAMWKKIRYDWELP